MNLRTDAAAAWMYRGLWKVLVEWFRVPAEPPSLPVTSGEFLQSFQPAPGFLRYLKFWFWLLFWPMDVLILIGWIAIFIAVWWLGVILLVPALMLAIVPDILIYIGLHLRYDTTWYVMTDRSLRIRRGIWVIHETTITFENVQNIKLEQGPVQRHFGIASLIVETAGAGGDPHGKRQTGIVNRGVVEGIANAAELRDRILLRLRESTSAGLGDERTAHEQGRALASAGAASSGWTPDHLAALREIRNAAQELKRVD